eukprot:TCONS_00014053-protein
MEHILNWLFFVVFGQIIIAASSLKNIGPIGDFQVYEYDANVKSLPDNINGAPVRKITHFHASITKLQEPSVGECIMLDCKYCLGRKRLRKPDSRCSCGCMSMVECNFANQTQNTVYLLFNHAQKCKTTEVFAKGHSKVTSNAAKNALLGTDDQKKSVISIHGSVLMNAVCGMVLLLMVVGIMYMIKRRCRPTLRQTKMRIEQGNA